nr:hypothetical protein [Tanacetum cinerariifolium]
MQDMLPGVLSTLLISLGLTVMNSSSLPIECHTTVNSSVLHSSSGLSMSWRAGIEYVELFEERIRRLDCRTQYAILGKRFDTSYPTGRYGISEKGSGVTEDSGLITSFMNAINSIFGTSDGFLKKFDLLRML